MPFSPLIYSNNIFLKSESLALIWDDEQILLRNNELPFVKHVEQFVTFKLLGELEQHSIASGQLREAHAGELPEDMQWVGLRQALPLLPDHYVPTLIRARQLNIFDRTHRFCSACAHPLTMQETGASKCCPQCNAVYFPKLSPAMMVLVKRGKELLLAHAPHFANNMYSALAGFVESGESVEDCIHREVMEEVGVRITNLHYMGSQSWPFPHSLMLAFLADYVEGEITPQAGEIEDARWFAPDALPNLPNTSSIAYWLIQQGLKSED